MTTNVTPAKACIQEYSRVANRWTPAFAGVTTGCEFIRGDTVTIFALLSQ
jgi:hypothetical protein